MISQMFIFCNKNYVFCLFFIIFRDFFTHFSFTFVAIILYIAVIFSAFENNLELIFLYIISARFWLIIATPLLGLFGTFPEIYPQILRD